MVRGGMQQCQEGGGTVTAAGSEALPSKSLCPLLSRRNCQLHLKSCTCVIEVRLGDLVPAINEQSREQFLWCEFQVNLENVQQYCMVSFSVKHHALFVNICQSIFLKSTHFPNFIPSRTLSKHVHSHTLVSLNPKYIQKQYGILPAK